MPSPVICGSDLSIPSGLLIRCFSWSPFRFRLKHIQNHVSRAARQKPPTPATTPATTALCDPDERGRLIGVGLVGGWMNWLADGAERVEVLRERVVMRLLAVVGLVAVAPGNVFASGAVLVNKTVT